MVGKSWNKITEGGTGTPAGPSQSNVASSQPKRWKLAPPSTPFCHIIDHTGRDDSMIQSCTQSQSLKRMMRSQNLNTEQPKVLFEHQSRSGCFKNTAWPSPLEVRGDLKSHACRPGVQPALPNHVSRRLSQSHIIVRCSKGLTGLPNMKWLSNQAFWKRSQPRIQQKVEGLAGSKQSKIR